MYWLQALSDQVNIPPRFYYQKQSRQELLKQTINNKLSGRAMLNVGLCVSVWDVTSIDNNDAFILQSNGHISMKVEFREIIFRPFRDEVLTGKIKEMDETGMLVTLEFFDEVFVSADQMMEESIFADGMWIWNYVDEEETDDSGNFVSTQMPMNLSSDVRVSVLNVNFYDKSCSEVDPEIRQNNVAAANSASSGGKTMKTEAGISVPGPSGAAGFNGLTPTIADRMKTSAFVVEASIKGEGFGLLSWW